MPPKDRGGGGAGVVEARKVTGPSGGTVEVRGNTSGCC